MRTSLCTLSTAVLIATSTAFAQSAAPSQGAAAKPAQTNETVSGEVRKVDKDARKITLRHGAIKQLDMPPMTMVFHVKEPALLDKVKAGDKVKFKAENVGGTLTVTEIETTK
jgi:Cu(I)/Ag(I) efflux system periplasmic protein CusF